MRRFGRSGSERRTSAYFSASRTSCRVVGHAPHLSRQRSSATTSAAVGRVGVVRMRFSALPVQRPGHRAAVRFRPVSCGVARTSWPMVVLVNWLCLPYSNLAIQIPAALASGPMVRSASCRTSPRSGVRSLPSEPLAKLRGLRLGAVPNSAGEHPIWPGSPTWEDRRHAERWKSGVPTCSRPRVGTPVGD